MQNSFAELQRSLKKLIITHNTYNLNPPPPPSVHYKKVKRMHKNNLKKLNEANKHNTRPKKKIKK